jgi:tetratricopeptide (TPR) repeat protein
MDPSVTDLLQQGIAAARAGKRDEARALLIHVVEADERNEQAWMWLSGVLDDPEDIRTCLHNALDLNPSNAQARQGLAWVDAKYGPPAPKAAESAVAVSPPIAAPRETPPAAVQSYTGPTTRLVPETPAPSNPPARSGSAGYVAPAIPSVSIELGADSPDTEFPCPYCGTPTALAQQNCTQCRQNLMIRTAPPAKRSLALTILGGLWIVNGVFTIIGSLLGAVGVLLVLSTLQSSAARGRVPAGSTFSLGLLVPIVIGIMIGVFIIRTGRGLLRRERWAYYVVIALSVLSLASVIVNLAQLGSFIATLRSSTSGLPASSARSAGIIVGAASAIVFVAIGFQVLYLVLVGLSFRDFFGPQVRFQPVVEPADDIAHYNNGIAYKNRDMWYMAVQEWFAASRKKPQDKTYLQALGLAYAQIKKLHPASPSHRRDVEHFLMTRRADLYALAPELEQIKLLG